MVGEFSDKQGDCDVMMTEEIVPEQEVVLEQVSRDDDMDLSHGTTATELDRSYVKLPQGILLFSLFQYILLVLVLMFCQ